MVLAAVKPVERFAAQELALVRQNGVFAEFSDRLLEFGDEARLGIKAPRLGNLHVKEGLVIAHNDAAGFALFVDAEHLNHELFFVLAEFFGVSIPAAAAATSTATALGAGRFITHLEIKQTE